MKLGGEFCEQSLRSPGGLRLLQAMAQTAAALGIQVVVTDMVNAESARMLHAHQVLTASA
ncbi:hypothetical protein D3C87_2085360 [compost metagenome]